MADPLFVLCGTAAALGCFHTLIGPDHYLPFVMMARARNWSRRRTAWITALCGAGHVLSSILLGFFGIAAGVALGRLERIESIRGDLAAWGLVGFGVLYGAWGVYRGLRRTPHAHVHHHAGGLLHRHTHEHEPDTAHRQIDGRRWESGHIHGHAPVAAPAMSPPALAGARERVPDNPSITPWVLFTIFVFGPCEPLIPLLIFPAAVHRSGGIALVAGVFGIATIATMLVSVLALLEGVSRVRTEGLERWSHALAGATLACCGVLVLAGL